MVILVSPLAAVPELRGCSTYICTQWLSGPEGILVTDLVLLPGALYTEGRSALWAQGYTLRGWECVSGVG